MTERKESRDISQELMEAFKTYGGDRHQLLKDHIRVDYLYALSGQRESLVDWYPFRPEGTLLHRLDGKDRISTDSYRSDRCHRTAQTHDRADQTFFLTFHYLFLLPCNSGQPYC